MRRLAHAINIREVHERCTASTRTLKLPEKELHPAWSPAPARTPSDWKRWVSPRVAALSRAERVPGAGPQLPPPRPGLVPPPSPAPAPPLPPVPAQTDTTVLDAACPGRRRRAERLRGSCMMGRRGLCEANMENPLPRSAAAAEKERWQILRPEVIGPAGTAGTDGLVGSKAAGPSSDAPRNML